MPKPDGGHELPPFDFDAWEGVRGPDYTQFPDELLDHVMPYLSGGEWKVLSYIVRKTFGWKKEWDYISTTQLERGVRDRESGAYVDRGTGLSRPTIRKAVQALEAKRLIVVVRQLTADGDAEVNCYRLRIAGDSPEGVGNKSTYPPVKNLPTGRQKTYPTRKNSTRNTSTPSPSARLADIADSFLAATGYTKPSRPKRERTLRVLTELTLDDGYTLNEVQTASEIAAALGARGPELIPHVIGRTEPGDSSDETRVGERLERERTLERERWSELTAQFDALPLSGQRQLLQAARASNRILENRPADHPLLRAAAVALLGTRVGPRSLPASDEVTET